MAKALRNLGHRVFVIAPSIPDGEFGLQVNHPTRDPQRADATPVQRFDPKKHIRNLAREWLLWPDPDIRWSLRAFAAAKAELKKNNFQPHWVITTSPPESIHSVGALAKKHYGAIWLADFRDHWFVRAFRLEKRNFIRRTFEQRYARRMLRNLDGFFTVNKLIEDEIYELIPNKVPSLVAPHLAPPPEAPANLPPGETHLVHTGSFSLSDPECRIEDLLTPFEEAATKNAKLRLHLVGRLTTQEEKLVNNTTSREQITLHGIVPLHQALAFQAAADGLIIVTSPNAPVPPGKYAEYKRCNTPIIPISGAKWATAEGLNEVAPALQMTSIAKKAQVTLHVDAIDQYYKEEDRWARSLEQLANKACKSDPHNHL